MDMRAKADAFRALHQKGAAFIIPNPWDRGSARLLAHMGFKALATTSMGYAFSIGQTDGSLSREQTLANARDMAEATDLPVSADLENGFGDSPEEAARTITMAGATGIVGGSIEDATGRKGDPIYDMALAVKRVEAAVAAARALPFHFTLTARAENYLHDRIDLAETIARLKAYEKAGADVLFAPGLRRREDIEAVVTALDKPVNVLQGLTGALLSQAELAAIGVGRISVGSSLARAALGGFLEAANEMREHGTFNFSAKAASPRDITPILAPYSK